ncbi:hypothetical protein Dsin_007323 [Dipteronia sinensis]|uniref:Reverse transcriptase domain-containing protein n=1 Tax=Dipteronia sinensis TaxID=43782 RepID=A0AAE0B0A8_9ROSI|nr:hypothetical protein Dsin_007323 [Dipteronia sinensis]
MDFLQEFHMDESIVKDLNMFFIALIPKVGKPETVRDFRPISLIGSMYKIASWWRKRLLANEKVTVGGLLIKLDFEKAYDSVDFSFLDSMMKGMGFVVKWRGWIKACISSPQISVLVNGSPTVEKGLRQCFELASGLHINFHKSCLVRVRIRWAAEVASWAAAFKCKKAILPITYLDERRMKWNWQGSRVKSHFVKAVANILKEGTRSSNLITDGLKIVMGKRDKADFWSETSWDLTPLRCAFPRIYALAINKTCVITDYGFWIRLSWVWEVKLRRTEFDWEKKSMGVV